MGECIWKKYPGKEVRGKYEKGENKGEWREIKEEKTGVKKREDCVGEEEAGKEGEGRKENGNSTSFRSSKLGINYMPNIEIFILYL